MPKPCAGASLPLELGAGVKDGGAAEVGVAVTVAGAATGFGTPAVAEDEDGDREGGSSAGCSCSGVRECTTAACAGASSGLARVFGGAAVVAAEMVGCP